MPESVRWQVLQIALMEHGHLTFLQTTVGKKVVIALTGLVLVGFVIAHMLGNLGFFFGQETINAYAAFLKSKPAVLWGARAVLLGAVVLHIVLTLSLKMRNVKARPVRYEVNNKVQATSASLTMALTGIIVLSFIVFHLGHFTLGFVFPEHYALHDPVGRHDVFGMMTRGFTIPLVAWGYVVAMVFLTFHLSHGVQSMFQTLGLRGPKYAAGIRVLSTTIALVVFFGFAAVPASVQLGFVANSF
ncbi:MAG: succinate dehydrogenase cytochrome b subunit [Bdellovibrionales bacterium]|nr:succinate dehydrogenase cytochrome b subunit [Bdellovibrionales bacterium]